MESGEQEAKKALSAEKKREPKENVSQDGSYFMPDDFGGPNGGKFLGRADTVLPEAVSGTHKEIQDDPERMEPLGNQETKPKVGTLGQ